jgi:transposase
VHRHALTDKQWKRLQKVIPKRRPGPVSDDRLFIDAVLYRAKTGCPWRDLPERFGPWKSVFNRFNNWSERGLWQQVFEQLRRDDDPVGSIIDGSNVRAHQDASGGKGGSNPMLWAALEEVFRPKSTPSRTRKVSRSTSR